MASMWRCSGVFGSWVPLGIIIIMASLSLSLSLFWRCAVGEVVPAMFVFGDSILDTGNNNYFNTWSKSNFPPYGRNFVGGKPTGRFSDGKIISDLLAENLGIKDLLPPYLDPTIGPKDLLTGVAFASGGCGFDPETPKLLMALSIPDQLKLFGEYKEKIQGLVGEEKSKEIVSQSLYLISAGNNDIGLVYFVTNRQFEYDMDSYATFLVSQASESVNELYNLGARKIGVFSTLVSGCVPEARTLAGGKGRQCAENFNELARLYNGKLISEVDYLANNLPHAKIAFVDLFTPLLDIITDPKKYGFLIEKDGCCATGKIEMAVLCNELLSSYTCTNTSQYIFWDGVHPTEKTNKILMSRINKYIDTLME